MDTAAVEYQCKLMNTRADNVGKHFSYFSQGLSAYSRKVALVRDKGDDLVDMVTSFAETETHNKSSRQHLHEFSHWLAMVQDFRHLSATRIVSQITPDLRKYGEAITALKANVKKCSNLNEKTKTAMESLQKTRIKSGEASAVYQTGFSMYRASATETIHQSETLRLHAKEFEEAKLRDLQKLLTNFVRSELMFHCRAIEMYIAAYRSAQAISCEDDVNEFLDAYEIMDHAPHPADATFRMSGVLPPERNSGRGYLHGSVSQPTLTVQTDATVPIVQPPEQLNNLTRAHSTTIASFTAQTQRPHTALRATAAQRRAQLQDSDTD